MLNDEFILKGDLQGYVDKMFASIDEAIVKGVNEAFTRWNIYHTLEKTDKCLAMLSDTCW